MLILSRENSRSNGLILLFEKKKKEYWLSSTLFKKWCHPRRYLGLGNELNRIVVIYVSLPSNL